MNFTEALQESKRVETSYARVYREDNGMGYIVSVATGAVLPDDSGNRGGVFYIGDYADFDDWQADPIPASREDGLKRRFSLAGA